MFSSFALNRIKVRLSLLPICISYEIEREREMSWRTPLNALEKALVGGRRREFVELLHRSPVVLAGRLSSSGEFESSTYRNRLGLLVLPVFTHKQRAGEYVARMKLQQPYLVEVQGRGVFESAELHAVYVNVFQEQGMWMSPESVARVARGDFGIVEDEEAKEEHEPHMKD